MRNKTTLKRVQLAIILGAVAVCSYVLPLHIGASIGYGQVTNRLEFVGVGVPLDKSTGPDDGAVLAVHFMGDTHGNLDTCG
jgi:hypothetical protein